MDAGLVATRQGAGSQQQPIGAEAEGASGTRQLGDPRQVRASPYLEPEGRANETAPVGDQDAAVGKQAEVPVGLTWVVLADDTSFRPGLFARLSFDEGGHRHVAFRSGCWRDGVVEHE